MSVATTKLFHPLTGLELAKIIESDVKRMLTNSQLLQEHLTFPKCTYKVEIVDLI